MTLVELKKITEDYFGVNLCDSTNKRSVTNVRRIFWYIGFMDNPNISLQELGDVTGHDYSNVHHHLNRFHEDLKYNSISKKQYEHFARFIDKFRENRIWIEQYNSYTFNKLARLAQQRKKANRKHHDTMTRLRSQKQTLENKLKAYEEKYGII